jgi:hypothetical protein
MQLRLCWFVVCDMVHHMIPCSQLHRDRFLLNKWPSCCLAVSTNPSNTRLSRWLLPKRQLAWVSDDVAGGKGRGWDCNETEHTPPCKLGSGSKRSTLMVSLVQPCHTERNKRNSCQAGLFHNISHMLILWAVSTSDTKKSREHVLGVGLKIGQA